MRHTGVPANDLDLNLDFEDTDASDILSPMITGMKSLKHLGLFAMKQSNFSDENLCSLVDNCKELNSLLLKYCEVSDDTIFKLINMKQATVERIET